jgi:hypothetical protein
MASMEKKNLNSDFFDFQMLMITGAKSGTRKTFPKEVMRFIFLYLLQMKIKDCIMHMLEKNKHSQCCMLGGKTANSRANFYWNDNNNNNIRDNGTFYPTSPCSEKLTAYIGNQVESYMLVAAKPEYSSRACVMAALEHFVMAGRRNGFHLYFIKGKTLPGEIIHVRFANCFYSASATSDFEEAVQGFVQQLLQWTTDASAGKFTQFELQSKIK